MFSSIAGAATYRMFTTNHELNTPITTMRQTTQNKEYGEYFKSFTFLTNQLARDTHTSAIFHASLLKQRHHLTPEQVLHLANLAIQNKHPTQLDTLAGYYPDIITKAWLNEALIKAENRFMYSALLRKHAAGKIKHLNYLFDPASDLVLIEQSDTASINHAKLFSHPHTIVLIDTEPYDPQFKYHT
jgi:hypothetical protein